MPDPTTGVYFSASFPPAPPGDQVCQPQSDGATPEQAVTFVPQQATTALRGTVKPDGTSITIDADGTIHAIPTGSTGGGGSGGGGTSASGGFLVCVVPSGAKDGSNTQYTLPAPVLAGTGYLLVRNGVTQKQLGTTAEYAVQGTLITTATPLQSTDWQEFYYVMGTPNSQTGGGGGTVPLGSPTFLQGNNNYGTGTTLSSTFPANNAAGSCLIVDAVFQEGFGGAGSFVISDSQGNSYVSAAAHSPQSLLGQTWYALNCAGGPNTVTVTYSGTGSGANPGMAILIHEYAAVQTVSAFDVDVYVYADSSGTTILPMVLSLTTTAAGDLLHLYASAQHTGGLFSNSGGWVTRETNNGGAVSIITFDALAGAAGVYSNSVNISTPTPTIRWQSYLLALKSA